MISRVIVSIAVISAWYSTGCGDDIPGQSDIDARSGIDASVTPDATPLAAPIMTHEPAWIAMDPGENPCFAMSLASADFDGDGRGDLLVGDPRCFRGGNDSVVLYRGQQQFFADEGVSSEIDWDNENPFFFQLRLGISTGDVNGDQRADVLLTSRDGIALFLGRDDFSTMFDAPVYRAPGPSFGSAVLADVDGDGDHDLALSGGGSVSILLTDSEDPAQLSFDPGRTIDGFGVRSPGDVDGDGDDDLLLTVASGIELYDGCALGTPTCDGGLAVAATWSSARSRAFGIGDVSGDDRDDVVVTEVGRLFMHLTDAQSGELGGDAAATLTGDGLFPGFATDLAAAGDIDGDGVANELLVGSTGRLYLYAAPDGTSTPTDAIWAWPEDDHISDVVPSYQIYVPTYAGDIDGDSYADIVTGAASFPNTGGRVMVFSGGVQPDDAVFPYVPEQLLCPPEGAGEPDLTVDADVLARSVYIEQREFSADSCEILEGCVDAPGTRRLLRFTVSIPNLGAGDAVVPSTEEAPELFYFDTCHGHDHLLDFARYDLDDGAGNIITGRKQGFYLVDIVPYCENADAPDAGERFPRTGISAGWSDVYAADYDCQWIDITDVTDGTYELRVSVDTADIIEEDAVHPNTVAVTVNIVGDQVNVIP